MSSKEELKEKIYNFLDNNGIGGTTFQELEDFIYQKLKMKPFETKEDSNGTMHRTLEIEYNLILWIDLNEEVGVILGELSREKKIAYKGTHIILYLSGGGKSLNLPIAKRLIEYKKPHWFPSIILTDNYFGDLKFE